MNTKIFVALGIGVTVGYFISNWFGKGQFNHIPDHKPMPTQLPDGTPIIPTCMTINRLNAPFGYLPPISRN